MALEEVDAYFALALKSKIQLKVASVPPGDFALDHPARQPKRAQNGPTANA